MKTRVFLKYFVCACRLKLQIFIYEFGFYKALFLAEEGVFISQLNLNLLFKLISVGTYSRNYIKVRRTLLLRN